MHGADVAEGGRQVGGGRPGGAEDAGEQVVGRPPDVGGGQLLLEVLLSQVLFEGGQVLQRGVADFTFEQLASDLQKVLNFQIRVFMFRIGTNKLIVRFYGVKNKSILAWLSK